MDRGHVDVEELHSRGAVVSTSVDGDLERDAGPRDVIKSLYHRRVAFHLASARHDRRHRLLLKAARRCSTRPGAIKARATDRDEDALTEGTPARLQRPNVRDLRHLFSPGEGHRAAGWTRCGH